MKSKLVKFTAMAILSLPLLASAAATDAAKAADKAPENKPLDLKDASYALGYTQGSQILNLDKELGVSIALPEFKAGLQDALDKNKSKLSEQQVRTALMQLQKMVVDKQNDKFKDKIAKVKAAGEKYLADNKKRDGVKTLDNGLQYRVIKSGNGKSPTLSDVVVVDYVGRAIDDSGKNDIFDQGKGVTLALEGVIDGWRQAIPMMKTGDTWEVVIPAKLGYGERGAPPKIYPESTLVFEITLVDVKKPAAAKAADTKEATKK